MALPAVALTVIRNNIIEHPIDRLKIISRRSIIRVLHLVQNHSSFPITLELILVIHEITLHTVFIRNKVVEVPVLLIEVHENLGSGIFAGYLQIGFKRIVNPVLHE